MSQSFDISKFNLPFNLDLKNPHKLQKYISKNKKELTCWGLLLASITLIYFAFSDGEFSFSYTLSAIIQVFGFAIIALRVHTTRSVSGLSLNTFICYSVSLLAKVYSVLFYEAYRPSDASGDKIFRSCAVLALAASFVMIYMIAKKYKTSYNEAIDRVHFLTLIVPAFVLACIVHPTLNDAYGGDIPWTFALYLEGLAMLPQLYMISKQGGEIETFTSHFVASQGFSLCFAAIFWFGCYDEVNENVGASWTLFAESTGYAILFCQIVQILLFSDFLYEYIKSMRRGLPMIIPL